MLYKQLLMKEGGLLSLSKSDCDLFLIAQSNTVTYRQLEQSKLHGTTGTGGRLSLKKLEKDGYVVSKTIPGINRTKFYLLTGKGRKRIERIFSDTFLTSMEIDLERRPPTSQQQLPHRIHTGDLYYSYLSCPNMPRLPLWKLEASFHKGNTQKEKELLPRCDGLLYTGCGIYYIEQDNCTQGDFALEKKINQYMTSELFLGKHIKENTLIFTLNVETKDKPIQKPPYSVYRILLKATKVWKSLESEQERELSFSDFCQQFDSSSSPCLSHLSVSDRNILKNLCFQHPFINLKEALLLKNAFLYDTSGAESKKKEQDILFQKRLHQKFYRILENRSNPTLLYRLRQGMHLFIVPNHQHETSLPYIFQKEYQLQKLFLPFLFHLGLLNLELWDFHYLYQIRGKEKQGTLFSFYNVFLSHQSYIIFEDIAHDLGGRERVRFFLRSHGIQYSPPILFVLMVTSEEDALLFLTEETISQKRTENRNVSICFFNKSIEFLNNPARQGAYFLKENLSNSHFVPAAIDYDDFSGELNLLERKVSNG